MAGRQFIEILISGTTIGLVYFLIAVGFSLIYGVARVLNLSYGSFFTWGAYLAWVFAVGLLQLNYFLVFLLVIPIMFLLGWVMEVGVVRPLRNRPNFDFAVLLATLGIALVLDNSALVIFGARTKSLPALFEGTVEVFGFVIGLGQITMLVMSLALAGGLALFLSRTRLGLSMRAVAQDPVGAQIVGIPLNRAFSAAFGVSTVLVGLSGILLAPRFFISPLGGWPILIKALIIVVAGGLGSIKGSLYAAFILGVLEALVGWKFGLLWTMPFWFIVLLLILLFKPQGLFGVGR
ncbi:MAG: branched-chain amino acid ABC transporter permease [Thermodesulfobacteriota bacterium]